MISSTGRDCHRAYLGSLNRSTMLKRFGPPRRRSTLRKIIQELDMIAMETHVFRISPKFEEANPILERFENSLLKTDEQ